MNKVVIIGPAWPLRGGLATFDQRLAKAFNDLGDDCTIFSFSLQYPSFLFPGKTQYSTGEAPTGIHIRTLINSVNPLNWIRVGRILKKHRPNLVVVRFWLPFMGPALGTILRIAGNQQTRIIAITDNVIPHEKRPGDAPFTRYFLKACHGFITMSAKVMEDLRKFEPSKPAMQVLHPLYDNFGEPVPMSEARKHLGLPADRNILLFFGFIRKYKGLDILFEAMKVLSEQWSGDDSSKPLLVVAGEFYEDDKPYLDQIQRLGISDSIILHTNFIPDEEVRYYLCAANAVVQPYRNATQSGVTPLAYHFEKPMIVTNVGGLPDLVPHHKAGIVAEPDPESIAAAILELFRLGENFFIPHLRTEKMKYSWEILVNSIWSVARQSAPK